MQALEDLSLIPEFEAVYPIPTEARVFADLRKSCSGEVRYREATDQLSSVAELRVPNQVSDCFVVGTKVWTDKGLVPIQNIKIGDKVLSQPERGGEREYRPVVNTYVLEDKQVLRVIYYNPDKANSFFTIYTTENHPFWIKGKGWTRADWLRSGDILQLADGRMVEIYTALPVYRTADPRVGWTPNTEHADLGTEITFNNTGLIGARNDIVPDYEIIEGDDPFFKSRVYNIEVESFHTYYVGKVGVWVHNEGCATTVVTVNPDAPNPPPADVAVWAAGSKDAPILTHSIKPAGGSL